ncbi:DUF418 domain-containing protein [Nocardiopsis kunsanensis]|uniref:Uncharacterized protein n=1 Tax=Nocardiopsis kunsanensis TaxID=141693 RepID=A0A918XKI6_9ACTN|nr:hypothetical protein [Nocardiopsis kunsanensis]GHD36293.1 hypothetical protein GCM10007147_43590 [Nocardiopsis kunsanensis]
MPRRERGAGSGHSVAAIKTRNHGQRWPGPYKWRALFLFVEGTVHFTLGFAFDVLIGYAPVELPVAWLLGRSERLRAWFLWGALGLHLTLMSAFTVFPVLLPASEGPDEVPELYTNGSYTDQVLFHLENFLLLTAGSVLRLRRFRQGPLEALQERVLSRAR